MADVKNTSSTQTSNEKEIDLLELLKTVFSNKKIIITITLLFSLLGVFTALLSTPIYQADALVQVESDKHDSLLGNIGSVFSGSGQASSATEIELIRSRMVLGKTIQDLDLTTQVQPIYFPVLGKGWARLTKKQASKIEVSELRVTDELIGNALTLIVLEDERYQLSINGNVVSGKFGELLETEDISILVNNVTSHEDEKFSIVKLPFAHVLNGILANLRIMDKGKDTGILLLSYMGPDKQKIQSILDSINQNYLLQNLDRKSEEIGKSLDFLNAQLPEVRDSLSESENKLNHYRQKNESVDLSLEAKSILDSMVTVETQLKELHFNETEISKLYTKNHPTYRALMEKKQSLIKTRNSVNQKVSKMPKTQQEILRLTRDVESGQAVYMQLLNKQQELQISKAGTVGNVRIIDTAMVNDRPIKPKKPLIVLMSTFLGFIISLGVILAKILLRSGLRKAEELENAGFNVYASVPLSSNLAAKTSHESKTFTKNHEQKRILSIHNPLDPSVEAIRSLRTTLHFAMMNAKNNILMISGATAGVGKSFISSNLACVIAQSNNKVLLIDCDMRKGYIHQMIGLENTRKGLSNYLARKTSIDDILSESPVKNLDVITRGQVPPNPSELLMSPRFKELLDWANENYSLVIVDTPPILPVTDAAIIGCHVGCSLLVARYDISTLKDINMTYSRFAQNGIDIKGVILNAVEQNSLDYKYNYYGYLDEKN